jgi:hypothetical protein
MVGVTAARLIAQAAPFEGGKRAGPARKGSHFAVEEAVEVKYPVEKIGPGLGSVPVLIKHARRLHRAPTRWAICRPRHPAAKNNRGRDCKA